MASILPLLPFPPPSPPPYPRLRRPPPPATAAHRGDDYHATLDALNSNGRRRTPRKSLGQHYMLNSTVNEQLCEVAGVGDGDVVLEIGPGTGSLTSALISAGATVLAVEKDPHMAMLVNDRFGGVNQLMVGLFYKRQERSDTPHKKYVMTANLYTRTSNQVLQEDFTRCHISSHMSSLLADKKSAGGKSKYAKDEVALRLADFSLRTSEYRPINIFVNFYSDPEYKFKVERTNFFPQPNVDAAVVQFKLKQVLEYPHVASTKSFFSMVSAAFNSKRKMLRKSLQHLCPSLEIEVALKSIGLPTTARPEELTMDEFVALHNLIIGVELSTIEKVEHE